MLDLSNGGLADIDIRQFGAPDRRKSLVRRCRDRHHHRAPSRPSPPSSSSYRRRRMRFAFWRSREASSRPEAGFGAAPIPPEREGSREPASREAARASPISSSEDDLAVKKCASGSSVLTLTRRPSPFESVALAKGSTAKSVIDLGIDLKRPSASRTIT